MAKSKSKLKNINLKLWVPIAVVALVIIISLVVLLGSKTRVAFLTIEEGDVEVDNGQGWFDAVDGMKLSVDDKVRTLNGKAIIILYESIIVQMDPDTEVSIEELSKKHTKLNQNSGSTWNKFAAIAGIKNFEIETPTTVATVRGTSFWVDMQSVGVTEGNVDVNMENKLMKVGAGKKAVLRQQVAKLESLTPEEVKKAITKKQVVVRVMKDLRQQEIEKHKTTYNFVKRIKGWNDADVNRYMDKMDNGEYSEDELRRKVVLPSETIDKFALLTKEIKRQKEDIKKLEQMTAPAPPPEKPEGVEDEMISDRPRYREARPEQPPEEEIVMMEEGDTYILNE
jgi:hypothetical protein